MQDLGDHIRDRWQRMPLVTRCCCLVGTLLGIVAGVVFMNSYEFWVAARWLLGLLACVGFTAGVTVGCILHTVFDRSRDDRRRSLEDEDSD